MSINPSWSNMLRSRRTLLIGIAIFFVLSTYSLWSTHIQNRLPDFVSGSFAISSKRPTVGFRSDDTILRDVYNSTLGFENVFVLNLPSRPDKLDQFLLASSVTGFTPDTIGGVKGSEVQDKSLPDLQSMMKTRPDNNKRPTNAIGCWRAHMNFAQTIVKNHLSSALIFEDDADWNPILKSQLELFARGSQHITSASRTPSSPLHSPYGDDWDMLWLGHCASTIQQNDSHRFIITKDPTASPTSRFVNFASAPNMTAEGYEPFTRIIYRASRGVCLYSYALSYRGARKLLRNQESRKDFTPIDVGIGDWCDSDAGVKCISVFPQIVDSHKGAGTMNRDSDIGNFSAEEVRERGLTFNIVKSTRLNLDAMLAGDVEVEDLDRQWPEDETPEGKLEYKAVGRVVE